MKLNSTQRKILGDRLLELANLLSAAIVAGAVIKGDQVPLVIGLSILAAIFGLYIAGLTIIPRYVEKKSSSRR